MSSIPVIDVIFAVLIILMVVHGYVKGFVEELFSWAGFVLAIWAAVLLRVRGAEFIRSKTMENVRYVPEILAFIAVFLIVVLAVKILEQILKDVVNGANLGGVNKFLGAIFGLAEGVAITVLVLFVLMIQPLFNAAGIINDSIFAQILLPLIRIPMERGKDIVNTAMGILPGTGFPVFPT